MEGSSSALLETINQEENISENNPSFKTIASTAAGPSTKTSTSTTNAKGLKRHFSLTDLPNAYSQANPFKVKNISAENAASKQGPRLLTRSNSLNPFSLNKSFAKSALKLSNENPFTMLVHGKPDGEQTNNNSQPTAMVIEEAGENPIISKRKRMCLEKENIPPEEIPIAIKAKDAQTSSSSIDLSDSESELQVGETEPTKELVDNASASIAPLLSKNDSQEEVDYEDDDDDEGVITKYKSANDRSIKPKEILIDRDLIAIDWSLRKSVTISSTCPLDWISSIIAASNKASPAMDSRSSSLTPARLFLWSAYTTPMPSSHSSVISRLLSRELNEKSRPVLKKGAIKPVVWTDAEKAEYAFFKEREDQWKKSFQNAYRRVKTGDLTYLSYTNSSFSMIFTSQESGSMKAMMSTSTPGFRMVLNEQEIEYEMVDGNGIFTALLSSNSEEKDERADLVDFEGLIPQRANAESSKPPNALLFKEGNVHAVFDLLLNWTDSKIEVRAQGPPKLLSNGPFLGATLTQCSISKPVWVLQGDKTTNTDMKFKLSHTAVSEEPDAPIAGLWSATLKNGNIGLCPLLIRDFLMFAASRLDEQNSGKTVDEIRCIFENDGEVTAFKGGNVYDGTLCVRSAVYSNGQFKLSLI